ncbi:MAG: hypothetical protein Q8O14_14565 [bacterium]|nr:hypothetical protein [bacterium]
MKTNSTKDPQFMETMAALMAESLRTENGLYALAEAVAPVIKLDIERRNIVPLVLTEHTLKAGQEAKYQKRAALRAFYVGVGGQAHRQEVNADTEVTFPIFRIHANPEVDVSDLANGNIGAITDMQTDAANAIRTKLNVKVVDLLSAAAATLPSTNVVTISGGKLTDTGLYTAIGKINDLELTPRFILIRGSRIIDLKDFGLDNESRREFVEKGILNRLQGAGLINSASMKTDEVILLPDMEVGKYAIRTALRVDPEKKGFKVGFLTWQECAMGITRPDLVFKVVITA